MTLFLYALLMLLMLPVFLLGFPVTPDFSGQLTNCLEVHGLALDRDRPIGDEGDGKIPYGGLALAVTPTLP